MSDLIEGLFYLCYEAWPYFLAAVLFSIAGIMAMWIFADWTVLTKLIFSPLILGGGCSIGVGCQMVFKRPEPPHQD